MRTGETRPDGQQTQLVALIRAQNHRGIPDAARLGCRSNDAVGTRVGRDVADVCNRMVHGQGSGGMSSEAPGLMDG